MKVWEVLKRLDFEFDSVTVCSDKEYKGKEAYMQEIKSFSFGEEDGLVWFVGFDNDEGDYKVTELGKARKELKELVERTRRKWTRIIVEDGYSVF